uniref:Putative reg-2-like protein n=1 Tax=Nyssomyia neivai TaxID=330878 RepID=A0A1L8DN96_9DIPT
MSLSRFRVITFDVTDTLLQFRTSPGKQFGEVGEMLGLLGSGSDRNQLSDKYKANWHRMNRAHPNFGLKTNIGWENWWRQLIVGSFRETGAQESDEKLMRIADHVVDIFKTSTSWQHCFGSVELLNYLKLRQQIGTKGSRFEGNDGAPFKIGVISNFDLRLETLLRNMKLFQYFDFVVGSYETGCTKPDPEIFRKAMEASKITDLQPSECLHIGNTPRNDYLGAKQFGWQGVLITERDPKELHAKYGDDINEKDIFTSLYEFHKKITNGEC